MNILDLIALWLDSAKVSLGNLATRRLNMAVDLFQAVKQAVSLWEANKDELVAGSSSGEFFGKVAEKALESPQKIQKLRNIVWLKASEYKALVDATGSQVVLDLGQDSRLAQGIPDYQIGFLLHSVIGANQSDNKSTDKGKKYVAGSYSITQTDSQEFMTLVKASIKLGDFDNLVKHFGSLSELCIALGQGKLWSNSYFAKPVDQPKAETETEKAIDTIALADHTKALNTQEKANKASTKETVKANRKLETTVEKLIGEKAKLLSLLETAQSRIKELESDNAELVKAMFDIKAQALTVKGDGDLS